MTIKATLENLKANGWCYYPVQIGSKLHVGRDGNWYRIIRNDSHEVIGEWNKTTGTVYTMGELAPHERSAINQIVAVWRPWCNPDWDTWCTIRRSNTKTLLPVKQA